MKPFLIVSVVATIAVIGSVQRSKLSDLKAETARLMVGKPTPTSKRSDRAAAASELQSNATAAQFEVFANGMIEVLGAYQNQQARPDLERKKQLYLAASAFSASDIARFFDLLHGDPRLVGMEQSNLVEACRVIFSETAPFAWRDYLQAHRDFPGWQLHFDSAVQNCLQADGKRAIAEFEQESARGNRDLASSGIRSSVLLKLVASDPDKMLAMAASPDFAADPDALAHLGGGVGNKLTKPEDHHRFLAALRRAVEKNPDSPLWQTVRKEYVRAMTGQLPRWPFEPMKTLVDGEFFPEEKMFVAEQASHRGDLDDKSKWADWFLGIDPGEWDRWIVGRPQQFQHPVVFLLSDWGRIDVDAASAWLKKLPPGDFRSKAVLEHASTIADRNPNLAAGYLAELPESREKQSLVEKIGAAKR